MAKKINQLEVVLKTLKTRKNGFTDAELIEKTGIAFAHTLRSKLKKAELVVQAGTKFDANTGRTVKTWKVA